MIIDMYITAKHLNHTDKIVGATSVIIIPTVLSLVLGGEGFNDGVAGSSGICLSVYKA